MCGIAGIIDFAGRTLSRVRLDHACDRLHHRGPDDRDTWVCESQALSVGLACTRLAVIDPRPAGRQPMIADGGRLIVVFNGEIYNHRALRDELTAGGCTFKSDTDTEVLLHGYRAWGMGLLDRLNGMWAFCIYDTQERCGFLARDRFGIKPLVYAEFDDELVFASEMSVLESVSNAPRELWPASVHHYLRFGYIPHPDTIYKHFHRLSPGHFLRFDADGPQTPQRYYTVRACPQLGALSYEEAAVELRARIGQSVKDRMVADVPLGAFLSGGLDSSIIVSHLAAESSSPPQTFSIGFEGQPRYDETHYAEIVAARFGTEHHAITLSFDDVIEHLPKMFDHLGEPFADASLIPTSLVSAHARRSVTVALSGDGADELFGGYYRYLGHHYLRHYQRTPQWMREVFFEPLLAVLRSTKSSGFGNRIRQAKKLLRTQVDDPLERHFVWSRILSPEAERQLDPGGDMPYFPAFAPFFEQTLGAELFNRWADDPLNQIMLMDLHYQLPADMLHKVDLASMYHSLEVRVPMLDPAVVELAAALPSEFKLRRKSRKRLLVHAYRDVLPAEILTRPKMGFELPIGEFLRGPLRDMFLSTVTREVVERIPPLDYDGIMQIYKDHADRRAENADILYALLVLCWWKAKR
ncbi:MAG: asparagine synthase (glutamine-hydrolyzing) [Planctomycetota bacterium]|nr:asparagine synthase (glutamine-hydrolyzing) [Planctomycetota bacterium]